MKHYPSGICTECNEHCSTKVVDFGIGPYEYWGAQCNDVQLCLVSQCCEAEVRDGAGDLLTLEDVEDVDL